MALKFIAMSYTASEIGLSFYDIINDSENNRLNEYIYSQLL